MNQGIHEKVTGSKNLATHFESEIHNKEAVVSTATTAQIQKVKTAIEESGESKKETLQNSTSNT
jgi:hypothetical protein